VAESEAKFRTLFESNSSAVLIHDDQQVLDCNPAALRIFGYKREELIGRHPGTLSPPTQPGGEDAMALAMWHLNQALENGTHQFEWMSVKGDGTSIPVEIVLTPTVLNGRPVLQALVQDISRRKQAEEAIMRDISERQRVQQGLERALAREREVSDLRANFVSLVSHEFRTPLGVIMSASDVLQRYFDRLSPEKRARHLDMILSSTKNLAALIDEVLLLGRVEEGRMQFAPTPLDLQRICLSLCDEIHSATKGVANIRFEACNSLEGAISDEALLRHIISNLLSNAVKYSDPGSFVDFTAAREGRQVVLQVRDHGIGIPEDEQARLFTSFTRGSNVGNRPGTGLGLVLVKRCVDLHGGELKIESRAGEGTAVSVKLPVFAAGAEHEPAAQHQK
jgi:PAS domain S-box-containing protein